MNTIFGIDHDNIEDVQAYELAVESILPQIKAQHEFGTCYLQRHLRVGYNRACRVLEQLEADGLIVKDANSFQFKVAKQ